MNVFIFSTSLHVIYKYYQYILLKPSLFHKPSSPEQQLGLVCTKC